jgi:hypothetical protein
MSDKPHLSMASVMVEGDKLLAGGQSIPLQAIKGVKVALSIPDGYWRWLLYSLGILFATGVLTGAIVLGLAFAASLFQWASPLWDWIAWTVFLVGGLLFLSVSIYGARANPAELHVELDLGGEKRVVYKSRRREDAYAYANRIKRLLGH